MRRGGTVLGEKMSETCYTFKIDNARLWNDKLLDRDEVEETLTQFLSGEWILKDGTRIVFGEFSGKYVGVDD